MGCGNSNEAAVVRKDKVLQSETAPGPRETTPPSFTPPEAKSPSEPPLSPTPTSPTSLPSSTSFPGATKLKNSKNPIYLKTFQPEGETLTEEEEKAQLAEVRRNMLYQHYHNCCLPLNSWLPPDPNLVIVESTSSVSNASEFSTPRVQLAAPIHFLHNAEALPNAVDDNDSSEGSIALGFCDSLSPLLFGAGCSSVGSSLFNGSSRYGVPTASALGSSNRSSSSRQTSARLLADGISESGSRSGKHVCFVE